MTIKNSSIFKVTSSPHVLTPETTSKIMWTVTLCLLPSGLVSVNVFGIHALWVILTAIASAAITEWAYCFIAKKGTALSDGSAVLTGLLLAYNLPPEAPLWMVCIGSFVAIAFGKLVFGGLGFNIFNPALIGRVFLMASFPVLMTKWQVPSGIDAVSAATPLAVFKDQFAGTNVFLSTDIINYSTRDLLFGIRGGCIGEACILALLIAALFLLYKKYISWHTPVGFIATVALLTWAFGGKTLFSGDIIVPVLSGGLILGAFYMATDYVTGPITRKGQLIFGIGCGIITTVIRLWGGYPEGVSYSILLMNTSTSLIDRFVKPKRFGEAK
ncbi:MAG: RnfABCDGE type electron transport complex subunit D [Candidatus Omnitrophica bacterium]|nr:RnfABCDGE type electron transport complex subunit D [Candidatus Omnitrophota bacterium]